MKFAWLSLTSTTKPTNLIGIFTVRLFAPLASPRREGRRCVRSQLVSCTPQQDAATLSSVVRPDVCMYVRWVSLAVVACRNGVRISSFFSCLHLSRSLYDMGCVSCMNQSIYFDDVSVCVCLSDGWPPSAKKGNCFAAGSAASGRATRRLSFRLPVCLLNVLPELTVSSALFGKAVDCSRTLNTGTDTVAAASACRVTLPSRRRITLLTCVNSVSERQTKEQNYKPSSASDRPRRYYDHSPPPSILNYLLDAYLPHVVDVLPRLTTVLD